MEPLIRKTEQGWRCMKCSIDFVGVAAMTDAETHGIYFHRILPDHFAMDRNGNYFDTRGIDPTALLREMGGS